MPREATVTQDQINAVASEIKAAGGKPTGRLVREKLGTGSMGTIHKLLQQWQAGQVRQADATLTLPPALQRAILDFLGQEISVARAGLETELAEQQQAATDLAGENERQQETIQIQAEALESMTAEKAVAEGRASQLEHDLEMAREEAVRERQAAEAARTEHAKAQLRLEAMPRLEADLQALRTELEKERQGRQQAEQAAAVLAAKLEATERRATESEARERAAQSHAEEARKEAQHGARELADARVAVQAGQARLETAGDRIRALEDRVNDLSGQVIQANAKAQREAENCRHAEESADQLRATLRNLPQGAREEGE